MISPPQEEHIQLFLRILHTLMPEGWELDEFSISWIPGKVEKGIFLIEQSRFTSVTRIPLQKAAVRSWLLKGSLFNLWIIQILLVPGHSDVHLLCVLLPISTSTRAWKGRGAKLQIG